MTVLAATAPGWNPVDDLRQLLAYHFMVNALAAASVTAVVGGVVGWFMVLRRQAFAGHTLSVVAFPGAAAAALAGVSLLWGYFGFCVAAAVAIGLASAARNGRDLSSQPAAIGVIQAFALACGFLFESRYHGFLGGIDALLFGTFLGVTDSQVVVLAVVGAAALAAIGIGGRRLVFASLDPEVAESMGLPVRAMGVAFLVVLGATVAEVSQVTGALLVFALLVMPAAAAQLLTARPGPGLALSVALGLGIAWAGLAVSYFTPWPPGFFVTTFGFAAYLAAAALRRLVARGHHGREPAPAGAPGGAAA